MFRFQLKNNFKLFKKTIHYIYTENLFQNLNNLNKYLQYNLEQNGYKQLTEIQNLCLQDLINRDDQNSLILSETGSGKSICYLLPILNRLLKDVPNNKTLVLAPTKELCSQIYKQFRILDTKKKMNICRTGSISYISPIVQFITPDEKDLNKKQPSPEELQELSFQNIVSTINFNEIDILITTPSQLKQIMTFKLKKNEVLKKIPRNIVIDEFDLLLADTNLRKQLQFVLKNLQIMKQKENSNQALIQNRQYFNYILTGASIPKNIESQESIQYINKEFKNVKIYKSQNFLKVSKNLQHDIIDLEQLKIKEEMEEQILIKLLKENQEKRIMIFVNSSEKCIKIEEELQKNGIKSMSYYSGLSANERLMVLSEFERKQVKLLICTDLGARGLDFKDVQMVIQYEFALDGVSLLHRFGRTCRMGNSGTVISFIRPNNQLLFSKFKESLIQHQDLSSSFSRKRSMSKNHKRSLQEDQQDEEEEDGQQVNTQH